MYDFLYIVVPAEAAMAITYDSVAVDDELRWPQIAIECPEVNDDDLTSEGVQPEWRAVDPNAGPEFPSLVRKISRLSSENETGK